MTRSLIWWIVGAVVVLELLSFMSETELRLGDLERLAVRKDLDADEGANEG